MVSRRCFFREQAESQEARDDEDNDQGTGFDVIFLELKSDRAGESADRKLGLFIFPVKTAS